MSDKNKNLEFSKYYKSVSPTEIRIDKEEIFYRDKYSEIINYIKIIITESEDLELYKYVKPKGLLLININAGTDILDFLKLISSNYYLNFIEFNYLEISKSPDHFLENFNDIISSIYRPEKTENSSEEEKTKRILMVANNRNDITDSLKGDSLLKRFLNYLDDKITEFNDDKKNIILIWLNYDYNEVGRHSTAIFNLFDLFIRIPLLNLSERETILRNFAEKNPKISFDINAIVKSTENWEVKDIKQLLKTAIFKHFLNADLNETSNEITDIIINLIESGEYIPSMNSKFSLIEQNEERNSNGYRKHSETIVKTTEKEKTSVERINGIVDTIQQERYSEFMLNQLYENAASKNYNELLIIIDKLSKNEKIEENDRKIIGKYPFVLNDAPNLAHINLEKAKKRVDQMKQVFSR